MAFFSIVWSFFVKMCEYFSQSQASNTAKCPHAPKFLPKLNAKRAWAMSRERARAPAWSGTQVLAGTKALAGAQARSRALLPVKNRAVRRGCGRCIGRGRSRGGVTGAGGNSGAGAGPRPHHYPPFSSPLSSSGRFSLLISHLRPLRGEGGGGK